MRPQEGPGHLVEGEQDSRTEERIRRSNPDDAGGDRGPGPGEQSGRLVGPDDRAGRGVEGKDFSIPPAAEHHAVRDREADPRVEVDVLLGSVVPDRRPRGRV